MVLLRDGRLHLVGEPAIADKIAPAKHAHARIDDWVLYALDSPWSGDARGFGRGLFFTRDGQLIASTAQEGLMRVVEEKAE